MWIPQEHFKANTYKKDIVPNSFSALQVGTVRRTNYADDATDDPTMVVDTVDVSTDIGMLYQNVPVMAPKFFDNYKNARYVSSSVNGEHKITEVIKEEDLESDSCMSTIDIDLPTPGTRVVLGFLNGKGYFPIVLGSVPNTSAHAEEAPNRSTRSTPTDGPSRKLYVHESRYWQKINYKGDFEESFPDGTKISISDTVLTDSDDLSEGSRFDKATMEAAKTVRIKHATGTTLTIKADGTVVIHATKIQIGDDGDDSADGLVLGTKLKKLFNEHMHPTGVGPSGTPIVPIMSATETNSGIIQIKTS